MGRDSEPSDTQSSDPDAADADVADSDPAGPVRYSGVGWHGPVGIGRFSHPAVFYRGMRDYLSYTVPFMLDGHAAREPVAVAVPGPNLRVLQEEFSACGGRADQVLWLDMTEAGRNPGRIIPAVLRAFADQHSGRRVRIIGEPIWPDRSLTEYPACVQHEALINTAFRGRQATILCPYDAHRLTTVALADAAATHPVLVEHDRWWHSPDYAPDDIVSSYNQPLPAPDMAEEFFTVAPSALSRIRRWATALARTVGLVADRVSDVVFVVNELVTNSIEHGTGMARLLTWATDTTLVFQTINAGRLHNPMAGRLPVPSRNSRGRGLLSVNMVADLVRIHTTRNRTAIRVHFDHTAHPAA